MKLHCTNVMLWVIVVLVGMFVIIEETKIRWSKDSCGVELNVPSAI